MIRSEYVNEYGENWLFELDQEQGIALLSGTDISDALRVPVIDGCAIGLVLNAGEQNWLRTVWSDGAESNPAFELYRGLETEPIAGKRYCRLSNAWCPMCLARKKEFETHHCVWRSDGGASSPLNLLRICRSCHALMSFGDAQDATPRDHAAFMHQLMHFGMRFLTDQAPQGDERSKESFLEDRPKVRALIASYLDADDDDKSMIDREVRSLARVHYQFARDVSRGVPAFVEYHRHEFHKP